MNIDSKFFRAIEKHHTKPFDWVTNNCGLFVANVYGEIYGKDFAEDLRGGYTDEATAFIFLQQAGGWEKILTDLGFEKRTDDKLMRGDVVVAERALGIWVGNRAVFAGGAYRNRADIKEKYFYKGDV